jgi:hypothetical protein
MTTRRSAPANVMSEISADRKLVRSCFGHPAVAYFKDALSW